ncbi:MAG: hypothetical protein PVG39_02355 [Desulfobacteraceae bacterium]|jgi:hypothetical protein
MIKMNLMPKARKVKQNYRGWTEVYVSVLDQNAVCYGVLMKEEDPTKITKDQFGNVILCANCRYADPEETDYICRQVESGYTDVTRFHYCNYFEIREDLKYDYDVITS